jgi:hypothetical protein
MAATNPVNEEAHVRIAEDGKRDYFLNKGKYQNPYSLGSIQFNDYERGWMQSLKYDNGRLVQLLDEKAKTASVKINQYALMKGREKPRG